MHNVDSTNITAQITQVAQIIQLFFFFFILPASVLQSKN